MIIYINDPVKIRIDTEAVSTMAEMNNVWNVNFLLDMSCVKKVSRRKLYLPRLK